MSDRIRSLDDFLALLKSVKRDRESQYKALCPGHNDREPSLSIKEADGKILLKCFSGCELADILKPLNLEAKDCKGGKTSFCKVCRIRIFMPTRY